jgi:hypothetical protein
MTEEIENIVLFQLRLTRADISEVKIAIDGLATRMSRLESAMLSVKREIADGFECDISQQSRADKLETRINRIEARLGLIE